MKKQNKKQNDEEEAIEPQAYIQIGDVVVGSSRDSLQECSKIALNIHKLKMKPKSRYIG